MNELEAELRALPEQIQTEALKLLQLTCDIEKERKTIADRKADAMSVIADIKESGKPKYSNSDMREVAVKTLLNASPEYGNSVDKLGRLEYQQRKQQINIVFFENRFQACRSIARLIEVKA